MNEQKNKRVKTNQSDVNDSSHRNHFSFLPDDILAEIFKYFEPKELLEINSVCKRFDNIISYKPAAWRYSLIEPMGNFIDVRNDKNFIVYALGSKQHYNLRSVFFSARKVVKESVASLIDMVIKHQPEEYTDSFIRQFLSALKNIQLPPLLIAQKIAAAMSSDTDYDASTRDKKFTIMECFAANRTKAGEIDKDIILYLATNSTLMITEKGFNNLLNMKFLSEKEADFIARQLYRISCDKIASNVKALSIMKTRINSLAGSASHTQTVSKIDFIVKQFEVVLGENVQKLNAVIQKCQLMHMAVKQVVHWFKQINQTPNEMPVEQKADPNFRI